jgi:hypothetical protein
MRPTVPEHLRHVTSGALAGHRTVVVHPALANVLPQGIVRGSSVACTGVAAVSMAFLLAAASSQTGAWIGVAGLPAFAPQACSEMGVALERVVVVRSHGQGATLDDDTWASVLGAMVDGFDIVVVGAAAKIRPATGRRVQARLQRRGGVLVLVGQHGAFAADVHIATSAVWQGLGQGDGHLRQRIAQVTVDGRRIPRAVHDELALPNPAGEVVSLTGTGAHLTGRTASPVPLRRTG